MGISRDKVHKRRKTGGKQKPWRKSRKFELGRPPSMTKIGPKRVHFVRTRGGHQKARSLRLEAGSFTWGSETLSRKTRILNVVYAASDNEFVRTNTLVKNNIVQIDATPFKTWYEQHYGVSIVKKKSKKDAKEVDEKKKQSKRVLTKLRIRQKNRQFDTRLEEQFSTGRLYAAISSRPGQTGRADGYILEGKELEFYLRKMQKKKEKKEGVKA